MRRWDRVRNGRFGIGCAGAVVAAHRNSKCTGGGCESRPLVVGMLWSSVSALKIVLYHLPTRPDGRDLDFGRFRWMDIASIRVDPFQDLETGFGWVVSALRMVWAFNPARHSARWRTPA